MGKSSAQLRHASAAGDDSATITEIHPDRLASIEAAINEVRRTLDIQFQRMAAMQAEIDLLRAKKRQE